MNDIYYICDEDIIKPCPCLNKWLSVSENTAECEIYKYKSKYDQKQCVKSFCHDICFRFYQVMLMISGLVIITLVIIGVIIISVGCIINGSNIMINHHIAQALIIEVVSVELTNII
jgi:uncharacterized membrane protein